MFQNAFGNTGVCTILFKLKNTTLTIGTSALISPFWGVIFMHVFNTDIFFKTNYQILMPWVNSKMKVNEKLVKKN